MTIAVPAIRVRNAGALATAILRAGRPLDAAAVFERSFYCRDAEDRWFCFLRDDLEPGPLHALSAEWPERLRDYVVEGQALAPHGLNRLASPTLVIDFGAMQEWLPPAFPPLNRPLLRDALLRLRQEMRTLVPPATLAGSLVGRRQPEGEWQKNVLTETFRALEALTGWFASPGEQSLRDAIQSLLGLGPGLTPTGDDILAGTLLTLHALGETRKADELAAEIETHGPKGTNRISLAHLRAAATGQGAAPFHDILVGLMRGESTFDKYLRRIDAVGHSSGWDILTGIVTTIESSCK